MAQARIGTINTQAVDGDDLALLLQNREAADFSGMSGTSAQAWFPDGMRWLKNVGAAKHRMVRIGTQDILAYVVKSTDRRTLVACNSDGDTGFQHHATEDDTIVGLNQGNINFTLNEDGLAINTATAPAVSLVVDGTDAMRIPSGTSAERPASPAEGYLRFNTDSDKQYLEIYDGSSWEEVSGSGNAVTVTASGDAIVDVSASGLITTDLTQFANTLNSRISSGTGVQTSLENGILTISRQAVQGEGISAEEARDLVADFAKPGDGISIVHNDTLNTLTFALDADTDEIDEGTANLYHTDARVLAAVSGSTIIEDTVEDMTEFNSLAGLTRYSVVSNARLSLTFRNGGAGDCGNCCDQERDGVPPDRQQRRWIPGRDRVRRRRSGQRVRRQGAG